MTQGCRAAAGLILALIGTPAFAQRPVPLADRVQRPLLPDAISQMPVEMSGALGYFFRESDGSDVAHIVGDFYLHLGNQDGQKLESREAVVWITKQSYQGRSYHYFEVLLWQDAIVREIGGSLTNGPALFVTFNSFGEVAIHVDDVAFDSSEQSSVYIEAKSVRTTFAGQMKQAGESPMTIYDPTGLDTGPSKPKPRPIVYFRSEGDITGPIALEGNDVMTVTGGIYLSRGIAAEEDFLEVRADRVVVFLPPGAEGRVPIKGANEAGLGREAIGTARGREDRRGAMMSTGFGDMSVEAVYLEGDVVMNQGPNMIRASRLYYDLLQDKALILDAVVRVTIAERRVPLYLRAAEIRQLSVERFAASQARLTTSEFHTPHYHVGATEVELTNRTPVGVSGRQQGIRSGSFRIHHATLNLAGTPLAYWPFIYGNVDTSETAIRSMRAGYSDDFGLELETEWHLFNVLGLRTPRGVDATLSLDLFTERGPAIGVDAEYERDRYYGEFRSYLMSDRGEDEIGREREEHSADDIRGRALVRHRQYLEDDWELSLELAYISDRDFLEEFFESEFENEKEQETLLRLKKQRDNWAFTATAQTRILDFRTQVERMPDLAYFRVGEPLGAGVSWYSENRLGAVRRRAAEQTFREFLLDGRLTGSGAVLRADSRQELGRPIDLGPVRLVPFVSGRATAWDDTPEMGGTARGMATYGVRGSMYLSKVLPDFRSTLFDLDGIRHLIKTEFLAWMAHANRDSEDLYLFDESVEGVDEIDGVMVGVRQRWQTKRGSGENRRTVDFVTLDVEAGFFNDASGEAVTNGYTSYSRPEGSIARNYVNSAMAWRLNDRTAILSEMNYDITDAEVDLLNLSMAVERTPRMSYLLGYRFIEETDSNLLGFDLNYRLTDKYTMAIREQFDLDRGRTLDFTLAFIRKFPRWFGAVSFELDEAEDDFGISFSIWPEGLPNAALGSRRFIGLAQTTRIRN